MADRETRAVVADLSGGRNAIDPPLSPRFGKNQCVDAVNVDYYRATMGRKRNGLSTSGMTFSSGGPFTGKISALARHVPGTDETAAEQWAVDDAATPVVGRRAGATTFAAPTLKDALTGHGWDTSFASLNGQLFIAAQTAQARLHVWDGSTVRRTGIAAVATAPTAADTGGSGTYPAVLRYYRVRFLEYVGTIVIRRSEPSPSVAFTPSGSALLARITRPTAPGEGETHWEVEASVDNVTFYGIYASEAPNLPVAIASTAADDGVLVNNYSARPLSDLTGTYSLQKSYRFLAADQGRLLGFGSWTATDKQNDVEVSAVIGSLIGHDAERVDTTINYRFGLDENDSGAPTGLRGPVFGNFYAFKDKQVWELAPTGTTTNPYQRNPISKSIGCVGGPASCIGEDAHGNPALYFMSHKGVYRYGAGGYDSGAGYDTYTAGGLGYIGKGIEDFVIGPTATINLSATKVICHLQYHTDKRQLWVWWATGSSNDPNQCAFYDVVTGGWTRVPSTDVLANARCSGLFANTIAAAMSKDLKPYIGSASTANVIYKADDDTTTTDAGTLFQAYVETAPIEPGGPGFTGAVGDTMLLAKAAAGITVTATVIPDFDAGLAKVASVDLTPAATESRVNRRIEDSALAQVTFLQYQLGDAAAVASGWTLDRLVVPYAPQNAGAQ
jgi:hypothetical protein